jgi:SAM-dependent methyltransferase
VRALTPVRRRLPWRPIEPSTVRLRKKLVADGASLDPARPSTMWRDWVNAPLRSQDEVDEAIAEVERCGLVAHQDRPKNWDLLVALGLILERCTRWSPILEVGAARYSPLLTWLYQYGFWNLRGVDLVYDKPIARGPIRLERMDLTRTTFPDHSFAAIASLSVIEHGVDEDAYLAEAARLLRPGGLLFTSTDYWCEPVDTGGQTAYGQPVDVKVPADIERFLASAATHGLEPIRAQRLDCEDRVVRWDRVGISYTFLDIALVARPHGLGEQARAAFHRIAG